MRAVLDACVLYPTALREILLRAAAAGLITPLWSSHILEEWARAAARDGTLAEAQARGEIALLRADRPEAGIAPDPALESRLWLPDPADIHVLATAVSASADAIVTRNAADFPRAILAEHGLVRHDPDLLLRDLAHRSPEAIAHGVARTRAEAARAGAAGASTRAFLKRAGLPRLGRTLG